MMEAMKNGLIFSAKYRSDTMLAPDDLRIVVFTNKPVDLSALTYDRWQLNDLQRRDGLLPEHGNMGLYVHRNH